MNEKLDKFTAARIRLFQSTGMAVQKPLPFDRPRFGAKSQLAMSMPSAKPDARGVSQQQQAS